MIKDSLPILRKILGHTLIKGWYLGKDLISIAIIGLLLLMVARPNAPDLALPSTQELPLLQVVPEPSGNKDQDLAEVMQISDDKPDSLGSENLNSDLKDFFVSLGSSLSESPMTFDLGQALMAPDLNKAAAELEDLAGKVPSFPPDIQKKLADAFSSLAETYSNQGMDEYSKNAQKASDALNMNSTGKTMQQHQEDMKNDMENVATDLKQLQENNQEALNQPGNSNGAGVGNAQSREMEGREDFQRLMGEGSTIDLKDLESEKYNALRPGETSGGVIGENVEQASTGLSTASSNEIVKSILIPFRFDWKWHDVVSSYFSR